jgi:hypothetical protein
MLIADPFNVKIYTDKTGRAGRPDDLVLSALLGNTRVEQLHTRAREGTALFTVASTVGEFFAVKLRSSEQHGSNPISRDT